MKRGLQGHYEIVSTVGEKVKAFIPDPLPPFPALEITGGLQKKLDEAAFLRCAEDRQKSRNADR